MDISVKTSQGEYTIVLRRGGLNQIGDLLNLNRKVLVVTDDGVPSEYAKKVANASAEPSVVTIPQGEQSKQMDTLTSILKTLVENNFTRSDCIVAVGGGVVGDMAGFAAAIFMRGIDFYNIPTTVLSQVDSSIGGKTAIDFMGYKKLAFYRMRDAFGKCLADKLNSADNDCGKSRNARRCCVKVFFKCHSLISA